MYQVTVLYGHPEDPEAFDKHYASTHAPLASKIPGLTSFTWGKTASPDGSQPPYYLVAVLTAPSADELNRAMATDEGKAAVNDVGNFATGGATMVFSEATVGVSGTLQ